MPEHVAALVDSVDPDAIGLALVNTDPLEGHDVVIQAGSCGEHEFTKVNLEGEGEPSETWEVNAPYLHVRLGPSAQARIELGIRRFAHTPSYAFPPLA